MNKIPPHKHVGDVGKPGQVVTPVTTTPYGFDRHPYLKTPNVEQTLGQYIERKQKETPKKLAFETWLSKEYGHCDLNTFEVTLAKDAWKAAQENV